MCGGGACIGLNTYQSTVEVSKVIKKPDGKLEGHACIHLKPQLSFERGLYAFVSIIQAEKMIQMANECFHLFHVVIKERTNGEIYHFCKSLHDGAHAFDEGLHAITVLGDLLSLGAGTFIERKHKRGKKSIDYTRTTVRILHFIAHGFSTIAFLGKMKVIPINKLDERLVIMSAALTLAGHTIHAVSLIWRRLHSCHHHEHNFTSDLLIQGTGIVTQSVFVITELNLVVKATEVILSRLSSIAIIIQSLFILHRLSPDSVVVKFPIPEVAA